MIDNKNDINRFLKLQSDLRQEILLGNKTWDDMINLHREFGYVEMTKDSVRRSFKAYDTYAENGWICQPETVNIPKKEITEFNAEKNTTTSDKVVELEDCDINNPEALLRVHGFNPKHFILVNAKNSKWQQGLKVGTKTLYSSKITVKPKNPLISDLDEIGEYFKGYKCEAQYFKMNPNPNVKEYLVLPLYDLHWGRYCSAEIGDLYNREIAKGEILDNVCRYFDRFGDRKFKKIYLMVGQDYFNSSFTGYTTSQAHKQDNDCTFKDMFTSGCELMIDIINIVASRGEVEVVFVEGNHARAEEYMLGKLVEAYYRNTNGVKIDADGKLRKYLDLGATVVGVSHGSDEKDRIFGLMQCEAPELWAKAKSRIWLLGHLHHLSVESKNGVDVYRIPSLTNNDEWTIKSGYTTSRRRTMAFVFDENDGLIETHFMNI